MKKTNWMMAVVVGAALAAAGPGVLAQDTKAPAKASATKAASQKTFATPEDAAKALVEAVRAGNVAGMLEVIGPESKGWVFTGDKVSDADGVEELPRGLRQEARADEGRRREGGAGHAATTGPSRRRS